MIILQNSKTRKTNDSKITENAWVLSNLLGNSTATYKQRKNKKMSEIKYEHFLNSEYWI